MQSPTNTQDDLSHTDKQKLNEFNQVFDRFIKLYIAESNEDNQGLKTYFESDWQSPCITLENPESSNFKQDDLINWTPFLRDSQKGSATSINLTNIENALEIELPIQAHAMFCRYFSHDINAVAEQGDLTILQAWNAEDFDRLQKNLIAHVLMKRRLKQADTLFFALTDEDDLLLSILLETGEVVLEVVGKEPHRVISPNLTEFMASIKPKPVLVRL